VHRIALCVFATVVFSCLASAQDTPRGEIFGGYSYLNVDYQSGVPSSSPIPRQSANGWEVSPAFGVNRWLAIEGDFAGYYKNNVPFFVGFPNADFHDYSFTAGPRFNYRAGTATAFVHALIGLGSDPLHKTALPLQSAAGSYGECDLSHTGPCGDPVITS
jgi:hypothetical protein